MKFSTIFSAAASVMFAGSADAAATLSQKWNISEDVSFEYSSLSFELGYTVSDYQVNDGGNEEPARVSLWNEGCKEGGIQILKNETSGIDNIKLDDNSIRKNAGVPYTPPEAGKEGLLMDRLITVNITLDSEAISGNSFLYTEDSSGDQVSAEIRFCVRFGLHTKSITSVEVNFLETLVTLNVDLTDGFEIGSIAVEPRDRLVRTANQVYLLEAYRCDASNKKDESTTPLNQGTVVRVCVLPDADARADGIKMRSIDDFTWGRGTTSQPAITGRNQVAKNELTSLTCVPGSDVCVFETILFAAFYTTPGAVAGSGVASMQFGTVNRGPTPKRQLRGDDEQRMLQEDEPAAAAEIELDFDVAQATPYGTSGATASFGVMASAIASIVIAALM